MSSLNGASDGDGIDLARIEKAIRELLLAIGEDPDRDGLARTPARVAEMYREIETARSILYRACITANPFPDPLMAAVAKITCNEMSNRVTSEAIQLHGGFGFTDEFAVSRLYRGARYGTLGGGTTETLRDLIGKRIMDAADTGAELLAYDMMNGG